MSAHDETQKSKYEVIYVWVDSLFGTGAKAEINRGNKGMLERLHENAGVSLFYTDEASKKRAEEVRAVLNSDAENPLIDDVLCDPSVPGAWSYNMTYRNLTVAPVVGADADKMLFITGDARAIKAIKAEGLALCETSPIMIPQAMVDDTYQGEWHRETRTSMTKIGKATGTYIPMPV